MGTSEVTHCFWKQLSWFVPSLLCDFHASQRWRCQNTTKSCPWYKAAARGWFQTSSSSRCSRRKRSGKRCCIQFPLCCVGRALTALSRRSGRLIPATLLLMRGFVSLGAQGQRRCPSRGDRLSLASCLPQNCCSQLGPGSSPRTNPTKIHLGSCILGTDPTDAWGGLGNNQFVPL